MKNRQRKTLSYKKVLILSLLVALVGRFIFVIFSPPSFEKCAEYGGIWDSGHQKCYCWKEKDRVCNVKKQTGTNLET